jgi:hypothetical protein
MKRLVPVILGKPVIDPWGVYNAALTASSIHHCLSQRPRAPGGASRTPLPSAPHALPAHPALILLPVPLCLNVSRWA